MSRLIDLIYLCAMLACSSIEAARILAVFPTPAISHQVAFRPLTHELVRRGHEVVVITTDPAFPKGQAPENLTEINLHDISYKVFRELVANFKNGDQKDIVKQTRDIRNVTIDIFEEQTALLEVQDIIKNKMNTFDLLIVEAWVRYALGFSHVIKAPVIAMSSFGATFDNYNVIGAPTHPLLYPTSLNTRLYNLTLLEKLNQYYTYYCLMKEYENMKVTENAVVRRIFGDNTPDLSELQNNVDMLFLNVYPFWEGTLPVPPGVINVGGIHQKPEKELPQDLKKYLDSSVHGVIYLSFGTFVEPSILPSEKIQTIIKVFSQLPYDVLWKWNQDEFPGPTKNIRISKWFPQSDLLRHRKIKLFITQGGLQSIDETIIAGVPVIGIPMLGDQWYNTEKCVHHKIGKKINLHELEEESFKSAIKEVIEDRSYRDNVLRLRTLMHDQTRNALERAVWWTEHVLHHGGARHLRAPAANMGWAEYYDVQLVLIVLSIAAAVIALVLFVFYQIVKVLRQLFSSGINVKNL